MEEARPRGVVMKDGSYAAVGHLCLVSVGASAFLRGRGVGLLRKGGRGLYN